MNKAVKRPDNEGTTEQHRDELRTDVSTHDFPMVTIVVPVYNEEAAIQPFLCRMESALEAAGLTYEIIFSMDPSRDRTEAVICSEIQRNPRIRLVVFSRRFGQPAATIAGMMLSRGTTCAVIDVDLQDPPELLPVMHARLSEGFDVVYARRRSRRGETVLKRLVSAFGYRVISFFSDVEIPTDTGDFRIMTRRVLEEMRQLNECHGFLRGLVAYVGFPQTYVEYDRDERLTGTGKYNRFTGSLKIGLNGLVSFSSRPLQLVSVAGASFAILSFAVGLTYVVRKLLGVTMASGVPTILLAVTFLSGVQLLALGMTGEYVGRIYDEVKRRPMYIIDRKINLQ